VKLAILLLIIVVAVLFLKLRSAAGLSGNVDRKNKLTKKKTPKDAILPTNNPHHAVSIEFDLEACPTVQSISDKFFLATQGPSIPLSECMSLQIYSPQRPQTFHKTPPNYLDHRSV